jgi:hypothetical protein
LGHLLLLLLLVGGPRSDCWVDPLLVLGGWLCAVARVQHRWTARLLLLPTRVLLLPLLPVSPLLLEAAHQCKLHLLCLMGVTTLGLQGGSKGEGEDIV